MTAFSRFQSIQAGKPVQQAIALPMNQTQSSNVQPTEMTSPPVVARISSSTQYAHPAVLFSPRSLQPAQSAPHSLAPVMAITVASTNSDAESLILSRHNSPSLASDESVGQSTNQSTKSSKSSSSRRSKSSKNSSETKLKKRLARKAELARASRRRKKAYISGLEDEIIRLKSTVERMKAAAANGVAYVEDQQNMKESLSSARKARRNLREGLKAMKEGASESDSDESSGTSDDSASDDEDESNHRSSNRSAGLVNVVDAMNSMEVKHNNSSKSSPREQSISQSRPLSIKITYLDDTRRLTLTQVNYRSLVVAVRSLWPSINQPIISYFDEDDDQVRITRDDEMAEACRIYSSKSMKLVVQDALQSHSQLATPFLPPQQQTHESDEGSVGSHDSLQLSRRLSQKRKHGHDESNQSNKQSSSRSYSKRRLSESQRSTDSGSTNSSAVTRSVGSLNPFSPLSVPVAMQSVPVNQPITQQAVYNQHMCVMLCLELVSEVQGQFSVTRALCSLPILATFHSLRDYLARNFFTTNPALSSSFVFLIGNTPVRSRIYDENATLLSFNCQNNDLVQFIHESLLQTAPAYSTINQSNNQSVIDFVEHDDDAAASAASVISTLAQTAATNTTKEASTICAAPA